MADQNTGAPVGNSRTKKRERKEEGGKALTAVTCLFTFAGTAMATLIMCGLIPVRPIPEGWHRLATDRTDPGAKREREKRVSGTASTDQRADIV